MMEENLPGLMKKLSSSPSRSPASSRGAPSARHRSAPARKPPEPLRRAVADCLSASSPHHSLPSSSEAARILRDYISSPQTVDVAYNVLVEHAVAEKDRSPAVVARCVALLRRYLLRYIPKEQTLQQIDLFCTNSIAECDTVQRTSGLNATTSTSTSVTAGSATPSSLPPTAYASTALVKSLIYVRSLVSRHIPRRSFQPAAFSGATSSKQSLPSLSSLLTKSFNSQLKPGSAGSVDSPDRRDRSSPPAPQQLISEEEKEEEAMYTFSDVLKWRWCLDREQLQALVASESEGVQQEHTSFIHKFADVGAAALLVGDMEAKVKGHSLKYPSVKDISGLHKLLQPAAVTAVANLASAPSHLKAITFVKRVKPGSFQPWEDMAVATFRPRARPLFQYRPYSEQQPLWLNSSEIGEVMAAVCSDETLPSPNVMLTSSRLTSHMGKPSIDIAVSVLVKLVIDMYILDSQTAAPLTLSLFEDMLRSSKLASRIRVFDLILNLGVHGHLLEPMFPEICSTIEEEASEMPYNNDEDLAELRKKNSFYMEQSPSIGKFESWLLSIFYEVLLLMVQTEEREEIVWASALSCLLYFVCDKGKICRKRLDGLDIRVVKLLLEISWQHSWAELVRNKLVSMLTNMLYLVPNGSVDGVPVPSIFAAELVDLLGGMDYVCLEYSRSSSENDKRNLFLVFFDYALYQINESCASHGDTPYSFDEVFPIVAMLNVADAPEAFYISVKHGLDGIGEILRRSISEALMRYPNFDRLNTLLEKVMGKYDASISSFASVDKEFSSMIRLTKSCKYVKSIEDGYLDFEIASKVKLSWATLHSLLHSEQMACRHNGYIWLLELLVSEISEDGKMSIWHNINTLRDKIGIAGQENSLTDSSVPLPIWILCGLLKSKHPFIKWGFLFVLEKLLMRWKLLLDENKVECVSKHGDISSVHNENRLEEANAVVDLLTSALSLVVQNNETDRINILMMCNIIFSQLCVRISSEPGKPLVGIVQLETKYGTNESITEKDKVEKIPSQPRVLRNNRSQVDPMETSFVYETASMAALVLKGHAVVPMRLVARIRPSLFYWPLMQLASDATDDIALGVAVGSKGRANLPGATSDIRAALLLLLIGRCTENASAFEEVGGVEFFRTLLDDTDSRVAYYSSAFLLKRLMTEDTDKYQHLLQNLILKAQQTNNEKLLENPYLQMHGLIQLSSELGSQL